MSMPSVAALSHKNIVMLGKAGLIFRLCGLAVVLALFGLAVHAGEASLSNADVERMVAAGLEPDMIVLAIQSSTARFDTSADDLIALKQAAVPAEVIRAMLEKTVAANACVHVEATDDETDELEGLDVDDGFWMSGTVMRVLTLVDGDDSVRMRYTVAHLRAGLRALGLGGMSTHAELVGARANLRIGNRRPSFIVAVPGSIAAEDYLTIVRLDVRKDDTRRVALDGSDVSDVIEIRPGRIVRTQGVELADQSRAPARTTLFAVTPRQDLKPGEYAAVILSDGLGMGSPGVSDRSTYFDFGID